MTQSLPKGWEEKTIGEVATIKGGKRIPKGYKLVSYDTGHPYIRVTDFNNKGTVDLSDIHFIEEDVYKQIKQYTISSHDLYISIAGTIGKSGIIPSSLEGANLTENACKLVLSPCISQKFLYYFTLTTMFSLQAIEQTKVAGQPKLALSRLASIKLKFPSLSEQRRITEKLDKIFADIDKAKENTTKNLQNAQEVFNAQLTGIFNLLKTDGAQAELQDVCTKISAGGDKPAAFSKGPTSQYKIPVYANGEQNDGLLGFTDIPTINQPAITVAARGTIGFTCKRLTPYCPIVRLISLIPNSEKISLDFLFYALKYLIPTGNGTSIPQLTLPTIRKFRISYPTSLDIQAKVVARLNCLRNATQELEKVYTKTLTILNELKQSILQQAFSGKL